MNYYINNKKDNTNIIVLKMRGIIKNIFWN